MEETLKFYKKAKEISDSILPFAKELIQEGRSILNIAEKIEKKIEEMGGSPAFPVNISINEIAAHYTPDIGDSRVLKRGDLVKVDFGVHVEGYIWDRAFSVMVGEEKNDLMLAAEKAVEEALEVIEPGVEVREVSQVIQNVLKEFSVRPIINLCGHGLERYTQHAPPTIPNVENDIKEKLREGQVVAIEVFTTNGLGYVKESDISLIFRFLKDVPIRSYEGREIVRLAKEKFKGLPFAKRWVSNIASGAKLDMILRNLVDSNALHSYPILKEAGNGLVAQHEETVVVGVKL